MNCNRTFRIFLWAILPAMLACWMTAPISAASLPYFWDTDDTTGLQAGNGTWNSSTVDWNSDSGGVTLPRIAWTDGNDANFNASGTSAVTVGTVSANSLTFNGTGYTLSGGALTVGAGGIADNAGAVINSPITLGAAQSWTVASGKTLTVGGAVATGGNLLTVGGAGNTLFTAGISTTTGGLTKNDAGTLTFSGANVRYTGATIINGGKLTLNNTGTSFDTSNTTVGLGATLEFNATSGNTIQINNDGQTITGTGTLLKTGTGTLMFGKDTATIYISLGIGALIDVQGGLLRNEYGHGNWNANQASLNIASGATVDTWDSAGGITVDALTGAGTLTHTSYGGALNATVGVANGGGTFSGIITDDTSRVLNLVKNGTGTQILTGTNTYHGTTTINGGTLQVGSGGTSGTLGTGAVTITSPGVLAFNRSDVFTVGNAIGGTGALNVNSGSLVLNGTSGASIAITVGTTTPTTATFTVGNTTTVGNITVNSGSSLGVVSGKTLTTGNLGFTATGTIVAPIAASYSPIIVGAGKDLTVGGGNSITLVPSYAPGLASGNYKVITLPLTSTIADATGFKTLARAFSPQYAADATNKYIELNYDTNKYVTWTGSSDLTTGTEWSTRTLSTISSPNWTLGPAATPTDYQDYDVVVFGDGAVSNVVDINQANVTPTSVSFTNASGNYTLKSTSGTPYGIVGSCVLSKSGAGALTISNANTYTGGTSLSAGTLNVNNASALGTGPITITGGTLDNTSAAAITLSTNNAQNWNGNFAFTGTKDLNMGSGAVTLGASPTVTVAGGNLTVGGAMSGAFGLTKAGAGTLILSARDTFTGSVIVNAGTLRFSGTGAGTASVNAAGRTYTTNGSGVLEFDGDVDPANAATFNGNGTLRMLSGLWYTSGSGRPYTVAMTGGTIDIQGGTFRNGGWQAPTWTNNKASLNVGAAGTFDVWDGNPVFVDALTGAGTVTHTANGATTTLNVGVNGGSGTFSGVITDESSSRLTVLAKQGAGTQILTGTNTYHGATSVTGGVLQIGNGGTSGTLGTGAVTITSPGVLTFNRSDLFTVGNAISGTGALTISGTGTLTLNGATSYTGATTVNAGQLVAGNTMTLGAVTVNNGGALGVAATKILTTSNFTLGSAVTDTSTLSATVNTVAGYTPIVVGGALAINSTGTGAITLVPFGTGLTNLAYYNVLSYPASSGDPSVGLFKIGNRLGFVPHIDTTNPTTHYVQVQYDASLASPVTWAGNSTEWSTQVLSPKNWTIDLPSPGTPTDFMPLDSVIFTNTASGGNFTVDINQANVQPAYVTFSNTTNAYTITSTSTTKYGITGSVALTQIAAGTVNIYTDNSYSGGTTIFAGGTVQIGNGSTSGTLGTGPIAIGGTLAVNRSDAYTLANTLSGSGALYKTGTNTLTVNGTNTGYTGAVTISQGTLLVGATNAFGTANSFTLGDASTSTNDVGLSFAGSGTRTYGTITVSNQGSGAATITTKNSGQYLTAALVIGRTTTVKNATTGTTDWQGYISGGTTAGTDALVLDPGAGATLRYSAATPNSFTGNVHLKSGQWQMQNAGYNGSGAASNNLCVPDSSSVTVDSGATWSITHTWSETIDALNGAGTVTNGFTSGYTSVLVMGSAGGSGSFTGAYNNGGYSNGIEKIGSGTQELAGAGITFTGGAKVSGGILKLTDTTGWNSAVTMNGGTLQLNFTTGSWTMANNIVTLGGGGIEKIGTGTVVLTPTVQNTYIGDTVVTAGTLAVGSGYALPSGGLTGNLNVAASGTLDMRASAATNGLTGSGIITSSTGGTILTVGNRDQTSTFAGVIQNAVGLTKTGAGMLTLTNVNTYTGPTTVNNGQLKLTGSLGDTAVTVTGAGTLGGSGTINTVAQAVTIGSYYAPYGGHVAPSFSTGTTGTTLNVGATLKMYGGSFFDVLAGISAGTPFNDVLHGSGATNTLNLAADYGGTVTVNLTDAGGLANGNYTLFTNFQNVVTYPSSDLNSSFQAGISPLPHRAYTFTQSGNDIVMNIANSANTVVWTGGSSADSNWLSTANWDGTLANGRDVAFAGSTRTNPYNDVGGSYASLSFEPGAASFVLDGSGIELTLDIYNTSSNDQRINMPVQLDGTRAIHTGGKVVTMGGSITNPFSGTNSLKITGTAGGTVVLAADNSFYAGDITVDSGSTLQVANANAMPNGSGKGNVTVGGKLDVNGIAATINGLSGAGTVTNGGGSPATFSAGADYSLASTFNGVLEDGVGGLAFTKTGGGNLTLAGANTYSGDTAISTGTLILANAAAIPSGTGKGNVSMNYNTTLDLGGKTVTVNGLSGNGAITNNGATATLSVGGNDQGSQYDGLVQDGANILALTKIGAGTLTLSGYGGANTYSGNTTVQSGTLAVTSLNSLPSGAGKGILTLNGGSTLDVQGSVTVNGLSGSGNVTSPSFSYGTVLTVGVPGVSVDTTFSGVISGSTGLTKAGYGTLTLSGAAQNTYSGDTTVNNTGTSTYTTLLLNKPAGVNAIPGNLTIKGQWGDSGYQYFGQVVLAADEQIADSSVVTLQGGALHLGGHTETVAGIVCTNTGNGAGIIENTGYAIPGAGVGTLIVNVPDLASYSFTGEFHDANNWNTPAGQMKFTKTGPGTQELAGADIIYTGATTVNNGTLTLTNTTAFASDPVFGATNSPVLQLNAPLSTDAWTFARKITGGALNNATLEKTGYGTVTLNPATGTAFSGGVKVSAGTLLVSGANLATNAASVLGGATLGGDGSLGATTVASTGTVQGGIGGSGTLTLESLTFGSGSGDTATVIATPSLATIPIVVSTAGSPTNSLTANGNVGSVMIQLTARPAAGTYHVLQYAGAIQGINGFSAFATNVRATLAPNTSDPDPTKHYIDLTVDVATPITWNGTAFNNSWVVNPLVTNWNLPGPVATSFMISDDVIFDGTAAEKIVDLSTANVAPSSVKFDFNTADGNYTLQGSAAITGATGLVMQGTGKLVVTNNNTYTGGTTVNNGTLQIGDGVPFATGSLTGTVTVNRDDIAGTLGTFAINRAEDYTLPNVLAGNGNMLKMGANVLTLNTASPSFTGTATVSQGTLVANIAGALGTTSGSYGSVVLGDSNTGSNPIVLKVDTGVANTVNLTSLSTTNNGTGNTIVLNSGSALSGNWEALSIGTLNLNGTVPLTVTATNTGGHSSRQDLKSAMVAGTGIGAGTTALTLDGTDPVGLRWTFTNTAGPNTFTGDVNMKGDVVTQNSTYLLQDAAYQNNGFPNNKVTVESGGTWHIVWGGETVASLNGAGNVNLDCQNALNNIGLTTGSTNGSGSYSGTINGGFGLAKVGTGTQVLSGAGITYTGATTVNAGTLKLTDATAFASSGVTMNGGTLELANTTGTLQTFVQNILVGSGAGNVAKSGSGEITLTGTLSYTGDTNVYEGTLNTPALTTSANVNVYDTSTLNAPSITTGTLSIGGTAPPPMASAVPEPSTLVLLALAGLALVGGYLRRK